MASETAKKGAHAVALALRSVYPANIAGERGANVAMALEGATADDVRGEWPEFIGMVYAREAHRLPTVTDDDMERVAVQALRAYFRATWEREASELGIQCILALMGAPANVSKLKRGVRK